jgi:putative endonuclease
LELNAGDGPFWVYVVRSGTTGKRYVGQSDDLATRVAQHNSIEHNPDKFTSKHAGPWVLVHAESLPTRAAAMKREKWLKSGAGRDWLTRQLVERSAAAD